MTTSTKSPAAGLIFLEERARARHSILDRASRFSPDAMSSCQFQVDALVGNFIQQATDGKSLAALTAGGMAYRAGRIGVLGLGTGNLVRAASVGAGLSAEVLAFEATNRSLNSAGENPNLWRWAGSNGIRQGLFQSLITFGALKSAGHATRGENLIAQHLLQDTAMVFGHQASGALGVAPRPAGTLAEQFLHAEATNLQIGAGMHLAKGLTGGRVSAIERGLDLSFSSGIRKAQDDAVEISTSFFGQAAPAGEGASPKMLTLFIKGGGESSGRRSFKSIQEKIDRLALEAYRGSQIAKNRCRNYDIAPLIEAIKKYPVFIESLISLAQEYNLAASTYVQNAEVPEFPENVKTDSSYVGFLYDMAMIGNPKAAQALTELDITSFASSAAPDLEALDYSAQFGNPRAIEALFYFAKRTHSALEPLLEINSLKPELKLLPKLKQLDPEWLDLSEDASTNVITSRPIPS